MNDLASLRIPSPSPATTTSGATTRKLCVGKSIRQDPSSAKVWLSPKSGRTLNDVRRAYGRLLDREVSTSLVVRRALDLLQDHLDDLHSRADAESEMAALMAQVR